MTIHHFNRNETYELYEIDKTFFFKGDTLTQTHRKPDLHSALWDLIDWIRLYNFTNLRDEDCEAIRKASRSEREINRDEVMNIICGKKINRLFYEHAYDLLYYSYMSKNEKFVILNNEHNFFIYEEIIQLMKFTTLKTSGQAQHKR